MNNDNIKAQEVLSLIVKITTSPTIEDKLKYSTEFVRYFNNDQSLLKYTKVKTSLFNKITNDLLPLSKVYNFDELHTEIKKLEHILGVSF